MELLIYLLKVSACTVVFFSFYLLVLRRLTFFKINRFYLLGTLLLSFIIPMLHFTLEREAPVVTVQAESFAPVKENELPVATVPIEPVKIEAEPFDYTTLISPFYMAIVLMFLVIATWRILQLTKYIKKDNLRIGRIKLVPKTTGFTNCSFFNYVFINEHNLTENELQILLAHESVHIQQYHSVDKILMLLAKAVLWLNPIVYLYDKALEETHEFEADETTSKGFGPSTYADLLLRLAVVKTNMPLVHNFVKSPIKERIKMLFNQKSKNMKKLIYVLALPIVLGLGYGFTVNYVDVSQAKNDKKFTLVIDAGHGGAKSGAVYDGVKEKDLTLEMAKKIKTIGQANGLNVVLTRNSDEDVTLADRVNKTGDFFLSLHVNSAPNGRSNGIELISKPYEQDVNTSKFGTMLYELYKSLNNLKGIKLDNRPRQASLSVLKENTLPSLAIEMGYITNLNDRKYILSAENQTKLANAILNAVVNYKNNLKPDEVIQTEIGKWVKGVVMEDSKGNLQTGFNLTTIDRTYSIAYTNTNNKVKIGDELNVFIVAKLTPPPPIGESNKFKDKEITYLAKTIKDIKGNLLYQIEDYETWRKSTQYAKIMAEANRVKGKYLVGKIERLHYFGVDKILDGFVLNVNKKMYRIFLDKEQLKTTSFKAGDNVSLYAPKAEVWFDSDYPAIKPKNLIITPAISKIQNLQKQTDTSEIVFGNDNKIIKVKNWIVQFPNSTASEAEKIKYSADDSTGFSKDRKVLDLYGNAKASFKNFEIVAPHININSATQILTAYNAIASSADKKSITKSKLIKYDMKSGIYTVEGAFGK